MKQITGNPPLPAINWREILWQEWQSCEDDEIADQLFELVAEQLPVSRFRPVFIIGIGIVYGVLAGLLMWLLTVAWATLRGLNLWIASWQALLLFLGIGSAVGVCGGLAVNWSLLVHAAWPKLVFRLRVGIIVGIIYWLLGGPIPGLGFGLVAAIACTTVSKRLHASLAFGPFALGLVAALFVGSLTLSLFGIVDGLTWWAVIGTFSFVFVTISFILLYPLGLKDKLDTFFREWDRIVDEYDMPLPLIEYLAKYSYHKRLLSKGKPEMRAVEKALTEAGQHRPHVDKAWHRTLRRLQNHKQQQPSIEKLISDLAQGYWVARFAAQHTLVYLGGEAVAPLKQVLTAGPAHLKPIIIRILENIAIETHQRLAANSPSLVCSYCLVRCQEHSLDLVGQSHRTFYGCRNCKQSREFFDCPHGVTAVLDAGWTEDYEYQAGLLRVNWISRRKLFDFDRVEIIQASDKTVELFAMQIGNDTDPVRKAHYKESHCLISSACKLTENSRRILQSLLGQVDME